MVLFGSVRGADQRISRFKSHGSVVQPVRAVRYDLQTNLNRTEPRNRGSESMSGHFRYQNRKISRATLIQPYSNIFSPEAAVKPSQPLMSVITFSWFTTSRLDTTDDAQTANLTNPRTG